MATFWFVCRGRARTLLCNTMRQCSKGFPQAKRPLWSLSTEINLTPHATPFVLSRWSDETCRFTSSTTSPLLAVRCPCCALPVPSCGHYGELETRIPTRQFPAGSIAANADFMVQNADHGAHPCGDIIHDMRSLRGSKSRGRVVPVPEARRLR